MNVVPIGAPGELYIGGAGVARGYLDRPALTAATFIPNPFSVEPGARLYKTGDMARFSFEGYLEFLGRMDDQLKVRGFRIEIGEIEAVLRSHKSVQEAIILARSDMPGGPQIVAYVVLNQTTSPPLMSELRNYLAQRLPNYMVPSIFVRLTELPLTRNGKVDRRALPVPNEITSRWQGSPVPPRTPIESSVAAIWADVLGITLVGRTDNFFDLGGHSLLAVQVVSRIRQVFQIELPLRTFFAFPTVSEIATVIASQHDSVRENDRSRYVRQTASSDELKGN
jgi:acyl carrier protein